MRKKLIYQLAYQGCTYLKRIVASPIRRKLICISAAYYKLFPANNSKDILSKNTAKNNLFVKKNRFQIFKIHRLKICQDEIFLNYLTIV